VGLREADSYTSVQAAARRPILLKEFKPLVDTAD
jgi:hypothetical protein